MASFDVGEQVASEAIARAAALDFEAFYEQERAALFRGMCLICGDAQEAEDVTQDAFVKLWERWDRLGAIRDVRAYMFRVAINEHRMRRRRAAIARRLTPRTISAVDDLDVVEDRHRLDAALAGLPPRQREALVLMDYLDLTGAEAAAVMRTTPENVRSLASHARATCRRLLGVPDG